jgi:hypothetical protein
MKIALLAITTILAMPVALAQVDVDPNVKLEELLVPPTESFTGPRAVVRSVTPPPEEVPAPATLALLGLGLVGLGAATRRNRNRS